MTKRETLIDKALMLAGTLVMFGCFFMAVASDAKAGPPHMMPPACRGEVCQLYGPGGYEHDWEQHVLVNAVYGKRFNVPAKACYSACVVAVGLALHIGAEVTISPRAKIMWGHSPKLLAKYPMPSWFRKLALHHP